MNPIDEIKNICRYELRHEVDTHAALLRTLCDQMLSGEDDPEMIKKLEGTLETASARAALAQQILEILEG